MSLIEENRAWLQQLRDRYANLPLGEVGADGTVTDESVDQLKFSRMQVAQAAADLVLAIVVYNEHIGEATSAWMAKQLELGDIYGELVRALDRTASTEIVAVADDLNTRAAQLQASMTSLSQEVVELARPLETLEGTLNTIDAIDSYLAGTG